MNPGLCTLQQSPERSVEGIMRMIAVGLGPQMLAEQVECHVLASQGDQQLEEQEGSAVGP
jgi:hypothetical protein